MDDRLYYVEGPQGQVLGPMTMIQILEGIAAGAILETARICGVGEQEWIDLSDVAYARDEAPEPTAAPGVAAAGESVDAPDPVPESETLESGPEEWSELDGVPEGEPGGVEMPISELSPEALGAAGGVDWDAPLAQPQDSLPASALPYDDAHDGSEEEPLETEELAGPHEFEIAEHDGDKGRPVRWAIPVLAGLGVPAIFGIYILVSGTHSGPLSGDAESPARVSPDVPQMSASSQAPGTEAWNGLHGEAGLAPPSGLDAMATPEDAPGSAAKSSGQPIPLRFELTDPAADQADGAPLEAALTELRQIDTPAPSPRPQGDLDAAREPSPGSEAPSKAPSPLTTMDEPADKAPVSARDALARRMARPLAEIRNALTAGEYATARAAVDRGRRELATDPVATANLDLWRAVCDLREGNLGEALGGFEKLDRSVSYGVSGFGPGTVSNWIARVHLSSGDTRSAIGALDRVGGDDVDEYSFARLWDAVVLASLGMDDLARRAWLRLADEQSGCESPEGILAVRTAQFLSGSLSEKEYRDAIGDSEWKNDMHYFLGFAARRANNPELAREHFRRALDASHGKEFPYHMAEAELAGKGLTGSW